MNRFIRYKKGYKYQLAEQYQDTISIIPDHDIVSDYIDLDTQGSIVIKKGYAWDGPSGPTVDTRNFMRGSLVHDALYQLMRANQLDRQRWRNPADRLLQQMCREDGMNRLRAWWVYKGVDWFAEKATRESQRKRIITAPKF